MAMSGLTRIAEYIPATEVTVARTWDAVSLTSLGYTEENITGLAYIGWDPLGHHPEQDQHDVHCNDI